MGYNKQSSAKKCYIFKPYTAVGIHGKTAMKKERSGTVHEKKKTRLV
jgi:hypothetical protein